MPTDEMLLSVFYQFLHPLRGVEHDHHPLITFVVSDCLVFFFTWHKHDSKLGSKCFGQWCLTTFNNSVSRCRLTFQVRCGLSAQLQTGYCNGTAFVVIVHSKGKTEQTVTGNFCLSLPTVSVLAIMCAVCIQAAKQVSNILMHAIVILQESDIIPQKKDN